MSPDLREMFHDAGRTPPPSIGWDPDDVVRRGARVGTRRRVLVAAASIGVAAAVVGGSAALVSPGLLTGPGVAPGGEPTTGTSTAPGPTTGPATAGRCGADDVRLELADVGGAAGTAYYGVVITGRPGVSCTVAGTPAVSALQVGPDLGVQVGTAARQDPTSGQEVTVGGPRVASFLVRIGSTANYDPALCIPVQVNAMRVVLPDDPAGSTDLALPATTVCSGDVSALGDAFSVSGVGDTAVADTAAGPQQE